MMVSLKVIGDGISGQPRATLRLPPCVSAGSGVIEIPGSGSRVAVHSSNRILGP
jgi:hypothetical protein